MKQNCSIRFSVGNVDEALGRMRIFFRKVDKSALSFVSISIGKADTSAQSCGTAKPRCMITAFLSSRMTW